MDTIIPLVPNIINGYDGFGGTHDNLIWLPTQGKIIYTLNNKVIEEDTKVRKQVIYADAESRLSCLAHNIYNPKYIAVGEGEPKLHHHESFIWVYDMTSTKDDKMVNKLRFHTKGVQSLLFIGWELLVSCGTYEENMIVIWRIDGTEGEIRPM